MKHSDGARYPKLLPYAKVRGLIVESIAGRAPLSEKVPVDSSLGRVSAERVLSQVDAPMVAISAMDGYAVRSIETRGARSDSPVLFDVIGSLQPSSAKPSRRIRGRQAYYVGTGAPVPAGADTVVKIEEARAVDGGISVSQSLTRLKNVVPKGDDIRRGSTIINKGEVVSAAGVALLIAGGRRDLTVYRRPRIGILSTGDELTPLGREQVGKRVNNYSNLLAGFLTDAGAVPVPLGVAGDRAEEILDVVQKSIGGLDGMITIGGSSVGERDFTAAALRQARGSVEVFHGIRLIPVRPTGLYLLEERPVILLPGHCIAAALSFFLTVKPIVNLLSGLDFRSRTAMVRASLSETISNQRPIGALFLVSLTEAAGGYTASPLPWASNRLSTLSRANAFLELSPQETAEQGCEVTVELLGDQELSRIARSDAR